MTPTVPKTIASDPLRLPDTFGATPLPIGISSDGIGIGPVVFDALVKHFGTVKELAYALGEGAGQHPLDPSQARAEIKAGDFRRLDRHAKPDVRAVVADAMNTAYGALRNADSDAELAVAQLFLLAQRLAQYVAFKRTA